MNLHSKNTFCSYCGTRFTEQERWPRKCFHCYNESYINPLPVVVAILPVIDHSKNKLGVLIGQRGIEPERNGWALPGGYIELGETWQQAIAREVMEEIGLATEVEHYSLMKIATSKSGNLIIFTHYSLATKVEDVKLTPNHETLALDFLFTPTELCFPTHTEAVKGYLDRPPFNLSD